MRVQNLTQTIFRGRCPERNIFRKPLEIPLTRGSCIATSGPYPITRNAAHTSCAHHARIGPTRAFPSPISLSTSRRQRTRRKRRVGAYFVSTAPSHSPQPLPSTQGVAPGTLIIGFGGEPDSSPRAILDAARSAQRPQELRYPASGLPERKGNRGKPCATCVEIDLPVVITNGGKQVYQAFATVIDEGDDVLLPAPGPHLPECIRLAGGNPIEVAGSDQHYKVTVRAA